MFLHALLPFQNEDVFVFLAKFLFQYTNEFFTFRVCNIQYLLGTTSPTCLFMNFVSFIILLN